MYKRVIIISVILSLVSCNLQYNASRNADKKKQRIEKKEERLYQKARKDFVARHLSVQHEEVRKRIEENKKRSDKEMTKRWKQKRSRNTGLLKRR